MPWGNGKISIYWTNSAHSLLLHYSAGQVNGVMLGTGRGNYLETDSSHYCETVIPILTDLNDP